MGLQQYTLSFKTNLSRAHHFHTAKFINAPGILLMERHTVTFIMVSYTYKNGHQSINSDQSFTDNATYKLTISFHFISFHLFSFCRSLQG